LSTKLLQQPASTVSYIITQEKDASKTPHKAYQTTHVTTINNNNKQHNN